MNIKQDIKDIFEECSYYVNDYNHTVQNLGLEFGNNYAVIKKSSSTFQSVNKQITLIKAISKNNNTFSEAIEMANVNELSGMSLLINFIDLALKNNLSPNLNFPFILDQEQILLKDFILLKKEVGIQCPYCNHDQYYICTVDPRYKCKSCDKSFNVFKNTILENKKKPMSHYYNVIKQLKENPSISTVELSKKFDMTQLSACRLKTKIMKFICQHDNLTLKLFEMAN